jgi:prepilin-type processing-associated H-X9-DG protein
MLVSIRLALLLAVASAMPEQANDRKAAAVGSLLGEEVVVVAYVDLNRADVQTFARRVVGRLADDEDVRGRVAGIEGWIDALKKAGAEDLFLLVDPADMPGLPVAVVPLGGRADGKAVADVLSDGAARSPIRWPASETIRGAVVAGTPEAIARIRTARPAPRADLAAALAAGGDAAVQVIIIPSTTLRRAIEESLSSLPQLTGGAPITTVTRDLRWITLTTSLEPKPSLRLVAQAKDAAAAQTIQSLLANTLDLVAKATRNNPALGDLSQAFGQVKPEARGDRVTLDADLEKTAELVSLPLRQAREARNRAQCTNNLKQIALAMHNYHSANSHFPAAYNIDKDGKPLLSWRVHILPLLEQKPLYDEFHTDEPWDSPHNKALIARMPAVYACPSGNQALAREGKTTYLAPRGPATIFPGSEPVKIQDITDGTSNTILTVDAGDARAVVWTKPEDWETAPELKTDGLFGHHPGGTNFAFADGAVRFLKQTIAPKLLQALTTRNGSEVVTGADY